MHKERSNYRADLDGMRAVAVVAVVLYHLDPALVPGGFVGVDVFFVLSGYFITRQIVEQLETGTFTLLGFIDRRVRRLLPALFLVLFATTIAASVVLLPSDFERFAQSLLAAAISLSNFFFWSQSGYFAPDAELEPLLHTWSLGVEEQFYLLFPPLILALWRFGRNWLFRILALICLTSFALSLLAVASAPSAAFYLLPFRAWELGLGVLLALNIVRNPQSETERNVTASVGLILIFLSFVRLDQGTAFPGFWALPPCLGTALIIWAGLGTIGERRSPILGALAWYPFVFVGLISYSLYLWHWPIFSLGAYAFGTQLELSAKLAMLLVAILCSFVSWRWVEQPLRRGTVFWPTKSQRFGYAGIVVSLVAGVTTTVLVLDGVPSRFPPLVGAIAQSAEDTSPFRDSCHADGDGQQRYEDVCAFGQRGGKDIVLFSDSHGVELAYALSETAAPSGFRLRHITGSSCPPASGFSPPERPNCHLHTELMLTGLDKDSPQTVIVTAFFEHWADEANGGESFWDGLTRTVERLTQAGHKVVLLGGLPRHADGPLVPALNAHLRLGGDLNAYRFPIRQAEFKSIDAQLTGIARQFDADYVPILPFVCGRGEGCRGVWDQGAIYFDGHHMTVSVARKIRDQILLPKLL